MYANHFSQSRLLEEYKSLPLFRNRNFYHRRQAVASKVRQLKMRLESLSSLYSWAVSSYAMKKLGVTMNHGLQGPITAESTRNKEEKLLA